MKDPEDKIIYNQLTQKNRLYQFLAGVNETFDKERRDLLLQDPLPTAEEAYACIRREIIRRGIMKKEPSSELDSSGSGGVFAVRGRSERSYRKNDERSHLQCTHCGGMRHTKNECFKLLVGYPDWWPNTRKKGAKMTGQLSDQPRPGRAAIVSSTDGKSDEQNSVAAMVKHSKEDGGNKGKQSQRKSKGESDPSNEGYTVLKGTLRGDVTSSPSHAFSFFCENKNILPNCTNGGFLIAELRIRCLMIKMIF